MGGEGTEVSAQPPTVARKMEARSERVRIARARLCTSGTDSHARSVLIGKVSGSELSRRVYQECVVGWVSE